MAVVRKRKLGEILVMAGKISIDELNEVLELQKKKGKKLGELLIEKGLVTEVDIIRAIEEQTGIKETDRNQYGFNFKNESGKKYKHRHLVKNL